MSYRAAGEYLLTYVGVLVLVFLARRFYSSRRRYDAQLPLVQHERLEQWLSGGSI
jgi:hypothetical protein